MFARLTQHTLWLSFARLGTQAGMALFTILLARYLGSEKFGEYAFMAALLVVGNMVTTFGTDMFLIREIAAKDTLESLSSALWLQLLFSILFIAGVFLFSAFFSFQSAEGLRALRIYSLALFPFAFFTVFTTALRGKQRMGLYAVLNFSLAVVQIGVACVLIFLEGSLVTLAWLLLLAQGLAAWIAGWFCSTNIPGFWVGWRFKWREAISLARSSAPVAVFAIIGIVYQRLALTVLPFLAGSAATGIFSSAARVVEMAKVGHIAVFTALYPMMAENRTQSGEWLKSFHRPWWGLLAVSLLATLFLFLLAGFLVRWLFGVDYLEAIPVLQILAWTLIPYTINNFLILAFLADGREKIITWALGISLLGVVILMAGWGQNPRGAGWAVVAGEWLQCGILSFFAVRRFAIPVEGLPKEVQG